MVKKLFNIPKSSRLTPEERDNRIRFVTSTIIGSGFECKCYNQDFLPFQQLMKYHGKSWNTEYEKHINILKETGEEVWLVIENKDFCKYYRNGDEYDI